MWDAVSQLLWAALQRSCSAFLLHSSLSYPAPALVLGSHGGDKIKEFIYVKNHHTKTGMTEFVPNLDQFPLLPN